MNRLSIISPEADQYGELIAQQALPELEVSLYPSPEQARGNVAQSDILLGYPAYLSEVLDEAQQLKWVQSTSAGVEELCSKGLRRDYTLSNIKDVFGPIMSEYVFGYIMTLERNILAFHQHQQQREWVQWDHYPYRRLSDLTLGVVGVGSIGKHIAATGKHFGMRVLGMKRSADPVAGVDEMYTLDQLEVFLPQVDYLVMVLPSTAGTYHFVNDDFLALMKAGSTFINVGRGSTVDEEALLRALQQGTVKNAVLDVLETEPLPESSPLWQQPNVLITPHVSALSFPAHIVTVFLDNYQRYLRGEPLTNIIDFERGY
ncbi:MAG: D-2-hydroxyacid dehydrogenase [Thiolinea sp.]